jgi:hypothetical protein
MQSVELRIKMRYNEPGVFDFSVIPGEIMVFERVRRPVDDQSEQGPSWELQEHGKPGQQVSTSEITEMCIEENILIAG